MLTDQEYVAAGRILLRLVETPGPLDTPCWIWPGARNVKSGYGQIKVGSRVMNVHRLLYRALEFEPAPKDHLHHRCETPACANPGHLTVLTAHAHFLLGNSPPAVRARQTECIRGHQFDAFYADGYRRCHTCERERRLDRAAA